MKLKQKKMAGLPPELVTFTTEINCVGYQLFSVSIITSLLFSSEIIRL